MNFKTLQLLVSLVILMLTISCKIEPEAINYGKDQCSFCKMNIVDKTHSAQFVTKKGKQFKFDAIECLVNDLNEKSEEDLAIILVANYGDPGKMIDAKTATYLISKEIKSPMGANLSALSTSEKAIEIQQKHTGGIYGWKTLKQKLSDKQ
ncbi:MAG: nitrous oxide reductase accessory protein NosL [Bacteroidetes bacterium]|nr:nitrous oxide reductase accessory protein NosL [Bacteroidota bacterium]